MSDATRFGMAVAAATFALALGASAVSGYDGGLDVLLQPLSDLNIAGAYLRHHQTVDAILFFSVFAALLVPALQRAMPGRPGTALATVLAASFTLALVLAEGRTGFSLQDFGPLAGGVFIGAVAVALYRVVHHLGLGTVGSGALAYTIAYFGARAAMPGLFSYVTLDPWLAWLHLGAVVALVVFGAQALRRVVEQGDVLLGHAAAAADRTTDVLRGGILSDDEARRAEEERREVSEYLKRVVDQPVKDGAAILADLGLIKKAIRKFGAGPEARGILAEKARTIAEREHALLEKLSTLRETVDRLRAFDLRLLSRLRFVYAKLSDEERARVKDLFAREVSKLALEDRVGRLGETFGEFDRGFRDAMNHAIAAIRLGNARQAASWIDRAVESESASAEILEQAGKLEEDLKTLTRIPISELKAQAEGQLELFP